MKKTVLNTLALATLFFASTANAQVGVGVPAGDIHPSAELEVKSTTKGFLPPRMTYAERNSIAAPATGLLIYQTDAVANNPAGLYFYDGTAWKNGLGVVGATGATGPAGTAGINGTTGATGPAGPKGDRGETGLTGTAGAIGPKGDRGENGLTGAAGAIGPKGDRGETGTAGANGTNGTNGSVGSVTAISGTSNANGAFISGGDLTLTPADASNGGVVTTDAQTFAGSKTFLSDLDVNGAKFGHGGGSEISNTASGTNALLSNTEGRSNTANGLNALLSNTEGSANTAVGLNALLSNTTGGSNTAVGLNALISNTEGNINTALGQGANVAVGNLSNATAIGAYAVVDASNKIQLGNSNVTNVNTSGTYTGAGFRTPSGTSSQYLMADGSVSSTGPAVSGSSHYIGESYGGGIVFYVYDGGQHGLIAATADQSTSIRWWGGSYTNTRAKADGVGAGLKNTAIIIANQGTVDGGAFAATVCNEYSVTVGGTTYGDWYLPSKHELNLLYLQKTVVGGFSPVNYWSSSEFDNMNACIHNFGTGIPSSYYKNYGLLYVRAIRSF